MKTKCCKKYKKRSDNRLCKKCPLVCKYDRKKQNIKDRTKFDSL